MSTRRTCPGRARTSSRQARSATTRGFELTLEHGADVDAKDSYNGTGLIEPLTVATSGSVRRLLQTEIDVDHVNRLGWTALLEAVILGGGDAAHTDVVEVLVEEGGVDVEIQDCDGKTALDHARDNGYREMVTILEAAER